MKIIKTNPKVNLDEEVTVSLTIREFIELYVAYSNIESGILEKCYTNMGFSMEEVDSELALYHTMRDFLLEKGVNV